MLEAIRGMVATAGGRGGLGSGTLVAVAASAEQPNAPAGLWNNVTHGPLVLGVIENVIAAYRIDSRRVHMTGFSQGGYMTWRFLCAHTELFASMAPAAAAGAAAISPEVGCTFTGADVPSAEIDTLYMHGHSDALVNFANATTLRAAVVAHYAMDAGTVVDSSAKFTRTRHTAPGGHVFEFLEHDYVASNLLIVGHCYPGTTTRCPRSRGS